MTVYWEDAFAINFLLDGLLLYLALKCVRIKIRPLLLLLSSATGGAEAIVFPLLTVPSWCHYILKFLGGLLISVIAAAKSGVKRQIIAACAFFAATFLFGGALVAIFSFFGLPYAENGSYMIEGAPVTLVLVSAVILLLVGRRLAAAFYHYRKAQSGVLSCKLSAGERRVSWRGFADSGNCLTFRGKPVCVLSSMAALALFSGQKPLGRMRISTVNGSRESPVFLCERMEIACGERKIVQEDVCLAVGEIKSKDYQLIIHTAYLEG